ncbi:MAG: methyltransferase [Pseudomonadota bacterium]
MEEPAKTSTAGEAVTCDGFLDNQIQVLQPAKGGHRSGLDAIFLAATVPPDAAGKVCDLGAGSGVAGLAVLARNASLTVDLVENNATMIALGEQSLGLEHNAPFAGRARVLPCDVLARGADRAAAGLHDNAYDHVITNPPYNDQSFQRSPQSDRAMAHSFDGDMLVRWCRTACAITRSGGRFSCIVRPGLLHAVLEAMHGRFGAIRILPLHPSADKPASRVLIGAIRGSATALEILPGLVLHEASGGFTSTADDVLRGRTSISLF